MGKVITTERLIIRELNLSDAEALYSYRSDKLINQYQGWIPDCPQDAEIFIKTKITRQINIPGTWFQFAIVLQENLRMIGDLGIHFLEDSNAKVEIGYTIDKDFHNKGYAFEAVSAIIEFIFTKLNKTTIQAVTDPNNSNSIKLLIKLGFSELQEPKIYVYNGTIYIDKVFELVNK